MIRAICQSQSDIILIPHILAIKDVAQNYGTRLSQVPSSGTSQTQEGFANGGALPDDFKLWLSRHPGLTIEEALHRYREEQKAKRRRQGPKL